MYKYLTLIIFVAVFQAVNGQDEKLVQFTGRVFDDFIQPLPYTHIVDLTGGRGTISDREGKFSFVARANDTIIFSAMGYKRSMVVIPDNLPEPFYTRDVLMQGDTFMIAEVEVYPWRDYEEFKEAFLNLELPDDDLERARKNIALIKTQIMMDNTPLPSENFNYIMQKNYNESFTRGTYPTYQIFNVFAWQKFFQALKNGDFKNKK
ncbi:MAG: hypothetical protein JXB34_12850 [Bacteroidales bacterium]|nr:hypothetical protein [Bacteroidales bacterium]